MSLLGLGYGLGGFMKGLNEQQRSQLQNQIYQQQFAQLQRQLAAQRLLGGLGSDVLGGGGVGGGLSNFQGQPQATSPAPMPPPQFGGTSPQSTGGAPTLIPGGALGGGGASLPQFGGAGASPLDTPGPRLPRLEATGGGSGSSAGTPPPLSAGSDGTTPIPQDVGGSQPAIGALAPIPSRPAPPPIPDPPALPPAAAAPTSPPSATTTTDTGGATTTAPAATTAPTGPDRQTLSFVQDLLDPQHAYRAIGDLRDRIAKAAPAGTDPATIWEATTELYKMVGGSINERAQAASIMKLAGLDLGYARLGATERGQNIRAETARRAQDIRVSEGQKNRDASMARMKTQQGFVDGRQAAREAYQKARDAANNPQARIKLMQLGREAQAQTAILSNATDAKVRKAAQDALEKIAQEIASIDVGGGQQQQPQTTAPPTQ